MKVKTVSYSRVFSMPNYENKKVGIEIEVSDGEHVNEVYEFAVDFVESRNPTKIKKEEEMVQEEAYKELLDEHRLRITLPEEYEENQVMESIKFIRNHRKDDLPF